MQIEVPSPDLGWVGTRKGWHELSGAGFATSSPHEKEFSTGWFRGVEGPEKTVQVKEEGKNREAGCPRLLITEPTVRKSSINFDWLADSTPIMWIRLRTFFFYSLQQNPWAHWCSRKVSFGLQNFCSTNIKIEISAQGDYIPIGKAWDRSPISNLQECVK